MNDELEPPTVELAGTAVDDFLSGLAAGRDERIAEHRPTLHDIASELNDMRKLEQMSSVLPANGGSVWARKLLHLIEDFIRLHRAPGSPMTEFKMKEGESEKTTAVQRMKRYLTYRVLKSKKVGVGGAPMTDDNGRPTYMALNSLRTLRAQALNAIAYLCYPKMTLHERQQAQEALGAHVECLRRAYRLKTAANDKLILRAPDIRAIVAHVYQRYGERPQLAVAFHLLIVSFFVLGARGGSLLATSNYPNTFLRLKNIVFIPERDESGRILAFTAKVTLAAFKGYADGKLLRIIFCLCSPKAEINLGLDLAIPLLASFMHRRVLPFDCLDDLLATDLIEFRCLPRYEELPVFLARRSRSGVSDVPMTLNAANVWLKDVLTSFGINTGVKYGCSFYACRRGFTTELQRNYGHQYTKHFLGHKGGSTLIHSTYDKSPDSMDITGGILGDGDRNKFVGNLPSHVRVPIAPEDLSVSDVVQHDPTYLETYSLLKRLKLALRFGSTAWLKEEPFARATPPLRQSDLPLLVVKLRASLQRLARVLGSQRQEDAVAKANQVRRALVWKDVERLRDEGKSVEAMLIPLVQEIAEENLSLFQDLEQIGDTSSTSPIEVETADFDIDDTLGNVAYDEDDDQDLDLFDISDDEDDSPPGPSSALDDDNGNDSDVSDVGIQGELAADQAACETYLAGENGHGPIQTASGAEHDLVHLFLQGPPTPLRLLRRLLELLEESDGSRCEMCVQEPYATDEEKAKLWPKNKAKLKQRHILTRHSVYARSLQWLKHHTQGDRWVCPFDDHAQSAGCDWTVQGTQYPKIRRHLERVHDTQLPSEIAAGLRLSTAAECKAAHKKALDDAQLRGYSAEGRAGLTERYKGFNVLRYTDAMMLDEELTTANHLLLQGPIDFGTDLLPEGLTTSGQTIVWDSTDEEESGAGDNGDDEMDWSAL